MTCLNVPVKISLDVQDWQVKLWRDMIFDKKYLYVCHPEYKHVCAHFLSKCSVAKQARCVKPLKNSFMKNISKKCWEECFFQKICLFFKDKYFAKMWFIYFDRNTSKKMFPTLMLHSSMQEYSLEEKKSKNHLNFLHFWDAITIWNKNHFDFLKTYHISNVTSILQK